MGTPIQGHILETHFNRAVGKAGFQTIHNWPPCFFHNKLKLFLGVHVDGFKLAGPRANLAAGWTLPRALLQLEDLTPVHLSLRFSCKQQRSRYLTVPRLKPSPAIRGITSEPQWQSTVTEFVAPPESRLCSARSPLRSSRRAAKTLQHLCPSTAVFSRPARGAVTPFRLALP